MKKNIFGGKLISVDGPNGVGKTTIIGGVVKKLQLEGYNVLLTQEPTYTELGKFTREISEIINSDALACLVAADRYEHLNKVIIPSLKRNQIVICDRYILSSLILQRMDNVQEQFILDINSNIILPDLQIALSASIDTIQERLNARKVLSRFEKNNKSMLELDFMKKGIQCLQNMNVKVNLIENNVGIDNAIEKLYNLIIDL